MSLLRPRLRATSMEQLDETTICHQTNTARSSSGASDGLCWSGRNLHPRSLRWRDMHSNLWVFPRGMSRDGAAGPNSVKWTSRYGSLAVSSYEAGTADGMNEKGLVMNGLYLVESDYGKPDGRPTMSIMAYGQYVLDNFASVAEAVDGLSRDSFRVIAPVLPNGRGAQVHMSLSDPRTARLYERSDRGPRRLGRCCEPYPH